MGKIGCLGNKKWAVLAIFYCGLQSVKSFHIFLRSAERTAKIRKVVRKNKLSFDYAGRECLRRRPKLRTSGGFVLIHLRIAGRKRLLCVRASDSRTRKLVRFLLPGRRGYFLLGPHLEALIAADMWRPCVLRVFAICEKIVIFVKHTDKHGECKSVPESWT